MVLLHSFSFNTFEMDGTSYAEQEDLVVKEAIFMPTLLTVSEFL
jgi:hypothetical protein